jgi:hypothetical protein
MDPLLGLQELCENLQKNQQHLVTTLFNLVVALRVHEESQAIMSLSKASAIALEVLDRVHHDRIGKTLGQIAREGDAAEIQRVFDD